MGLLFGRRRFKAKKESVTKKIPFMRFLGPGTTLVALIFLAFFVLTGRIDLSSLDSWMSSSDSAPAEEGAKLQPMQLQNLGAKSPDTVRVATFNIQAFGEQKSSNQNVMRVLSQIVSQFDVVAIQEVGSEDAVPIQRLVDLLNASGGRYTATVSEPIGRQTQLESYAFVWDEARIQLVPRSAYVVTDSADRMHREPMVASFQVRTGAADGRVPFRFTMINANTSPSEAAAPAVDSEMNVLDDVFNSVREFDYRETGEEDFILLGDLNVDTRGLLELGQIPGVVTIAGDTPTNTLRNQTFDHILIDRTMTREFTGNFGVIDLQNDFQLSEQQAIQVSDHLPLWAEFSAYEIPRFDPIAERPANPPADPIR